MKFNPDKHHRKSIRLKEYDYSQVGYYFVTICTHNRENIFAKITDGEMLLNELGNIAVKILLDLPNRFKNIKIDANIFMPNHLHAIIIINEPQNVGVELVLPQSVGVELALPKESLPKESQSKDNDEQGRASSAPTLGRIIQVFKSVSTIEINRYRGVSGVPVWQRNYYEHIIRNEKELYEIRKYIEFNPVNWNNDEYNV